MITKQKNRVRSLMKRHGHTEGLAVAMERYTEAFIDLDDQDMDRWHRELHEVCSAPVAAERQESKPIPKTFSAGDIIRARGMGVLIEFPRGRRSHAWMD